ARQGRIVGPGDVTIFNRFGTDGLLGRRDFLGLVYLAPPKELSSALGSVLLAVIVTAREATAALEYGSARVLAALGSEAAFFPTAFWSDRDRGELRVVDTTPRESILAKVAVLPNASTEIVQIAHPRSLDGGSVCVGREVRFDDPVVQLRLPPGKQL